MTVDNARERYLRDRVLTASPAQRVVMLYDRLGLDLGRGQAAPDRDTASPHLAHAMQVLAELRSSLDLSAGGPAENLASIYGYLLGELVAAQAGERHRLGEVRQIVASLRDAWSQASVQTATAAAEPAVGAGRWVG